MLTGYQEAVDWLYAQTPQFQQIGAAAYKPGLDTTRALDALFGQPHRRFATIHVGGTNGKGSTAHTLAAILQSAGYRTGLYTSPHLVDFRERMRVDGAMIPKEDVVEFINRFRESGFDGSPSFFELTTLMAFDFFAREKVDVAVIEVGLGGRLDSTNIIIPELTVITNISHDHHAQLGTTLKSIALEKSGIFKPGIPAVVGEAVGEVKEIFSAVASLRGTPLTFADQLATEGEENGRRIYLSKEFGRIEGELTGLCQEKNAATICAAVSQLKKSGYRINDEAVKTGFAGVCSITGLMGRWMKVSENPTIIADTGHNEGGWQYLSRQLGELPGLAIILGFVSDKDVNSILRMLPQNATYFFTRASVPRAMEAETLRELAAEAGIKGFAYPTVADALTAALATNAETIFVGGSTFVVADLLAGK